MAPDEDAAVATLTLLLLHVPPAVASVNSVLLPAHTKEDPAIGAGTAFTLIMEIVAQPVGSV
jgi:hypothetical protein